MSPLALKEKEATLFDIIFPGEIKGRPHVIMLSFFISLIKYTPELIILRPANYAIELIHETRQYCRTDQTRSGRLYPKTTVGKNSVPSDKTGEASSLIGKWKQEHNKDMISGIIQTLCSQHVHCN